MGVDETDTKRLLTDLGRKPILQQNYTQIDRDKQG